MKEWRREYGIMVKGMQKNGEENVEEWRIKYGRMEKRMWNNG